MNSHCVYCGIPVEYPLSVCRDCGHRWRPEASASPERSASERSEVGASKGGEAPVRNAREAASRLEDLAKSKSALASAASSALSGATRRSVDEARSQYERALGMEDVVAKEEAMTKIREALETQEHEQYMSMMATPEDFAREQRQRDSATYDNVMDKIQKLEELQQLKSRRSAKMQRRFPDHPGVAMSDRYTYIDDSLVTVEHVKQTAEVLRAMRHLSENDDALIKEPWFTYEQVVQQLDSVGFTELTACISTLSRTGLVETDSKSMKVRLRTEPSFQDWRDSAEGIGSENFNKRMRLRDRIRAHEKKVREKKVQKKKVDPTPWVYQGASEEALLAVEAMHPKAAKIKFGSTPEGARVYAIREVADHRPFEVIFGATGLPVENVQQIRWSSSWEQNDAAFTMIKDLLAALIKKLERASIGYLCRGCGELDPADMQAGTDWHVVITQDHDRTPGGHGAYGECLTCPVEAQEQCGPIVKVGGA